MRTHHPTFTHTFQIRVVQYSEKLTAVVQTQTMFVPARHARSLHLMLCPLPSLVERFTRLEKFTLLAVPDYQLLPWNIRWYVSSI